MRARQVQLPQMEAEEINNLPQCATIFLDSADSVIKGKLPDGSLVSLQGGGDSTKVDDLIALSGVPEDSINLGTFTGDIIPDDSDNKEALQALETAIEDLPNPITYKGTWNATTNTPALANTDTGKEGFLYQVNVAGTHNFGAGAISFEVGDKVVNNGTIWEKWDMTDAVSSVNGLTGDVVLTLGDNLNLANDVYLKARNAADDGDIELIKASASDAVEMGVDANFTNIRGASINLIPQGGDGDSNSEGNFVIRNDKKLYFQNAANNHAIGFRAPESLSVDEEYVLPETNGNSGDFLSTDGTGQLIWRNSATRLVLTTDQSNTQTSGTITNIADFNFAAAVSSTYLCEYFLLVTSTDGATSPRIKINPSYPASTVSVYGGQGGPQGAGNANISQPPANGTQLSIYISTQAGDFSLANFNMIVKTGASTGNIVFGFQGINTSNPTLIKTGSFCRITKLM